MTSTPPSGTAQTDAMIFQISAKSSTVFTPAITDIEGSNNLTYWAPGDIGQTVNTRPIMLGTRYDGAYAYQGYSADWEWVRVRKTATPAPVSVLGSLEVSGAPYTLSGDPGTWRFRKPVSLNYAGSALTAYQVNVIIDTTTLAVDRNTLTWTDTTSGETGFRIERCDGADCTTSSFPRIDKTIPIAAKSGINSQVSYTDRDTAANVNYCYRVKAVNAAWTTATPTAGESPASTIVCQLSDNPGAPTDVKATPGASSIAVSWTDNSKNEAGFMLERCQDNTNGETQCAFLPGNITVFWVPPNDNSISSTSTYNDTTVGCSGIFRYRITAYRGDPNSPDWSRGPTALSGYYFGGNFTAADSVAIGIPAPPTNVVATRVTEQQINVTWTDNTPDESGFEVWRCASPNCTNFAKLPVTVGANSGTGGTVTYNDTFFITPGTAYGYQVRSVISGACAATSDASPANAGREYATASYTAPSGFTATGSTTTKVDLAWTDTTSAETGFAIKRCAGPAPCGTSYSDVTTTAGAAASYSDTSVCSSSANNYTFNYSIAPMLSPSVPFTNAGGQVWKSKSPLNFTNFQPNFITQVVVTYDADMQSDYRDIRFFDRDAQQELPYWIESSSTTSAIVWFKTGATAGIDLYFGNAAATTASSKEAVFGTGLVGYWPFEESSQLPSALADVSGSGNSLTTYGLAAPDGVVSVAQWPYGKALSLDGVNDNARKSAPTGLPTGGVMAAEAWIFPKGSSYDYNGIVSWGARVCDGKGFGLSISSAGLPQIATWCNDFSSAPAVTMNAWNHIAVSLNGTSTATIYLNGQAISGPLSKGVVPNVASTLLSLGTLESSGGTRYFKGLMDEVRVYNRELTAADIAARYAAAIPTVTVGQKSGTGTPGTAATANVVTAAPGNILVNWDFENYTNNWTLSNSSYVASNSTVFFSGRKSVKVSKIMSTANEYQGLTQPINAYVAGGRSFTLTGYVNAQLTNGLAFCKLAYNADGSNADRNGAEFHILATDSDNNQGWKGFTQSLTLPDSPASTAINVMCGIWTGTGGAGTNTAYFDAIQLAPNPPVTLTATRSSESQIALSWNDPFTDKTGFNIYRCQGSGCSDFGTTPYKQVAATVTAYMDTGLTPNLAYSYKVSAYKSAACPWESAASLVASATAAQVAPVLLAPTPLSATSMQLAWNDTVTAETGYTIDRCSGNNCDPAGVDAVHFTNVQPTAFRQASALKAFYSFNGTISDSSGSGLNLALVYSNQTLTYEDNGLLLSPFYSLTSATTSILDTNQHTIEFDVKIKAAPTAMVKIFGFEPSGSDKSPGIWVVPNDTRLHWRYDPADTGVTNLGVSGVGGISFTPGTWYHIAGVKNGNSLKVYVNGNLVADAVVANPKTSGPGILRIGGNYGNVVIRNLGIYNTALDPTMVAFTDTQACPSTYYNYRVTPYNAGWSGGTAPLSSNTAGATSLLFRPPGAPVAKGMSDVQVDLSWSASSDNDQTGFTVQRCQGGNCQTTQLPNQTSYSDTGLAPLTAYNYSVASFKATASCNGYTDGMQNGVRGDATGITSAFASAIPAIITTTSHLTAEAMSPFKVRLSWTDTSSDVDGFDIETRVWNGQWVKTASVGKKSGTNDNREFIDTVGIEPRRTYTYRVRAIRGTDRSTQSNEAAATTPPFTRNSGGTCP